MPQGLQVTLALTAIFSVVLTVFVVLWFVRTVYDNIAWIIGAGALSGVAYLTVQWWLRKQANAAAAEADLPVAELMEPMAEAGPLEPLRLVPRAPAAHAMAAPVSREPAPPLDITDPALTAPPLTHSSDHAPYRIFVSYQRASDGDQQGNLLGQLEQLENAGLVEVLCDGDLRAGDDWWRRLNELLRQAEGFLLLVSSNSIRSESCRKEWTYALDRLNAGATVIPVLLDECQLDQTPLARLPPANRVAIRKRRPHTEAWRELVTDLRARLPTFPRVPRDETEAEPFRAPKAADAAIVGSRVVTVWVQSADADKKFRDQLHGHLATQMQERHLEEVEGLPADLVLVLVTADYLRSCVSERDQVLAAQRAGKTIVVPIIVKSCTWEDCFGGIQAPRGGVAVTATKPYDDAWKAIAQEVRQRVTAIRRES